jgi:hypothetical protein
MDPDYMPTIAAYIFQVILFNLVFILSYLSYRYMRYPERSNRIRVALRQLGYAEYEVTEKLMSQDYRFQHYALPLLMCTALSTSLFSMTHPATIRTGAWDGVIEVVINIFNLDGSVTDRSIFVGRFLFWGWLGAYVYSSMLIYRRYMAYDLTPMVYIFAATRFMLAFTVGSIVGLGLGTASRYTVTPSDLNLSSISVIVFFIGFFPDQGLDWIVAFSKRALGQRGKLSNEQRLGRIEGLSIWQQSRLQQEGIDNVQNLATTNVSHLVIGTPFTVGQIVDWVDQATLLLYANEDYRCLEKATVRCASDLLAAAASDACFTDLVDATEMPVSRLRMLVTSVESAVNIRLMCRYRWRYSMNTTRIQAIQHYSAFFAKQATQEVMPASVAPSNPSEIAVAPATP